MKWLSISVGSNPTLSANFLTNLVLVKLCTGCGKEKPLEAFSRHAGFKDGRNSKCRSCKGVLAKHHYNKNRDQILARQRKGKRSHWYKVNYGITVEDYKRMLGEQGGVCAICGEPPSPGRHLDVDHCHTSGAVRGLLCRSCNAGLGSFK